MSDSDDGHDGDSVSVNDHRVLHQDNQGMIDNLETNKPSEISENVDNSHQIVIEDDDTDGSEDDTHDSIQDNDDVDDIIYHKKPSGRPPKGKIWNTTTGLWIENIDVEV